MNKPINIQTFVCEISKCPDIQRLKSENEELKNRVKAEIHLGNNYKKDFAEQVKIAENYRSALENVRDIVCPKDRLLIVDSPIFKQIQDKINEVLKDE